MCVPVPFPKRLFVHWVCKATKLCVPRCHRRIPALIRHTWLKADGCNTKGQAGMVGGLSKNPESQVNPYSIFPPPPPVPYFSLETNFSPEFFSTISYFTRGKIYQQQTLVPSYRIRQKVWRLYPMICVEWEFDQA